MKGRTTLTVVVALGCVLALASSAVAADFSPTASFSLSTKKKNANPALTIEVAQNQGEEELLSVKLTVPKKFKLPGDAAIDNNEVLGQGTIEIATAPLCTDLGAPIPVRIIEADRQPQDIAQGAKAVWVVDLQPVTTIRLLVKGSTSAGWTLSGAIPQNAVTCPPFNFTATINATSSVSGTKILVNPSKTGNYVFKAMFTGVNGSVKTISQSIRITA